MKTEVPVRSPVSMVNADSEDYYFGENKYAALAGEHTIFRDALVGKVAGEPS